MKPQYVDNLPRAVKGTTEAILKSKDTRGVLDEMCEMLELNNVRERSIADLSGGELQRFAIAVVCVQVRHFEWGGGCL